MENLDLNIFQESSEQNLLNSLNLESALQGEEAGIDLNDQNSMSSSVDLTLQEIKKLRIIDKELEKAQFQAKPN